MTNSSIFKILIEILTSTQNSVSFCNSANPRRIATMISFVFLVYFLVYGENVAASQSELNKTALTKEPYVKVKLADVTLIDQDGNQVKFASEAIGDRIVAINFIYTTCSTLCPLTSAIFKQLQDKLGKLLSRDIWLISISLDPLTDTPARLKEYASKYRSNPGWIWLTGSVSDVEQVLTGLGTTSANFREHAPLNLVGDGKNGKWIQFNALTGPEQIRAELERMLAERKSATTPP